MMVNRFYRFLTRHSIEIALAMPLVLYIAAFTYVPVFQVVAMSFDASGETPGFVFGLENYRKIFGHFQFMQAFFNTLFITFVGLSLELTLGLFIAIQLNKRIKFRGIIRALLLIPLGVPTIVVASIMRYIFDTNGFVNHLLLNLGLVTHPIDWGRGGLVTLLTIVVADMWKVTPMVMLILLAGLQNIQQEIYEAAKIDGAYAFDTFRRVTLPMLKPSITMALIIRGIDSFRILELPLVLAGKSEPVLSTFAYFEYQEALNPYASAADSVILLILILLAIISYLWITGGRDPAAS